MNTVIKEIARTFVVALVLVVVFAGSAFVGMAFTPPSSNPPIGSAFPPVNTNSIGQLKAGDFSARSLTSRSSAFLGVGAGSRVLVGFNSGGDATYKMEVLGKVKANDFCTAVGGIKCLSQMNSSGWSFGGMWSERPSGANNAGSACEGAGARANPITGNCSCPSGYSQVNVGKYEGPSEDNGYNYMLMMCYKAN